jgi:CelD/BcsL family acetyltransferase involved in cellulose biosynthesis
MPEVCKNSPSDVADKQLSVEVKQVDCWESLIALSSKWNDVLSESSSDNFFLTWEWISSWWTAYAQNFELFVLICSDITGTVLGIAPLYRATATGKNVSPNSRTLRLIGDGSDDADNFNLLIRHGFERICVSAILDRLEKGGESWDLVELNSMPTESVIAKELLNQFGERGWPYVVNRTPHLIVELPKSWEEYASKLPRKVRQTWNRKRRRAEKKFKVALQHCCDPEKIADGLRSLVELHQKSWESRGNSGKFADDRRRAFYNMITERANARGWLDLWILTLDGVAVSARYGFRYGNTRYAMQAGSDPNHAAYAVGTINEVLVIAELIKQGVRYYDFLAGDDPYKLEFGPEQRQYLNVRCARPHTPMGVALSAERSISGRKLWLKSKLPKTLLQILRWVSATARGLKQQ